MHVKILKITVIEMDTYGIVTDENELEAIIRSIESSNQIVFISSKLMPGYYYWNTTGSEHSHDFPTIYFKKELYEKIKKIREKRETEV